MASRAPVDRPLHGSQSGAVSRRGHGAIGLDLVLLRALALVLVLAVGIGSLTTGCGQPTHEEVLAVYDAPAGDYRVRYLEPPWHFADATGTTSRFRIEANAVVHGGLVDAGIAPKYQLTVSVEGRAPGEAVRREQRAAESRGADVVTPAREIETALGEVGWELATRENDVDMRYGRVVFLAHSAGSVRLGFESSVDLETPEIDVMIDDVDVEPEAAP